MGAGSFFLERGEKMEVTLTVTVKVEPSEALELVAGLQRLQTQAAQQRSMEMKQILDAIREMSRNRHDESNGSPGSPFGPSGYGPGDSVRFRWPLG